MAFGRPTKHNFEWAGRRNCRSGTVKNGCTKVKND
jgi:hypothetical protein